MTKSRRGASARQQALVPYSKALDAPEFYINRELSLLEFNARVLAQAQEPKTPLLERLKFLCISSTNLDEFFEVRVASVMQKAESATAQPDADNLSHRDVLAAISHRAHELVAQQYRVLNDELLPALQAEHIRFLKRAEWNKTQRAWLADYFEGEVLPVLSPLGLDPAHPFPRILNKSLNFIVSLEGQGAFGRSIEHAIVQAPRALPRLIRMPKAVSGSGQRDFVFLSSVIHAHIADLFPSMATTGCYQFRVTRNSELLVDEEEIEDLMRAVEGELPSRRYADAVRLEVAHNCPDVLSEFLLEHFSLGCDDLYQVNGPVNMSRLMAIFENIDRPALKFPPYTPSLAAALVPSVDLFASIRERDRLLHHPYDSFLPVVELVRRAARDPLVLAIKQTLYRTGADSAVVDALVEAASGGKEVTVVIELRARFDEADNIELANRLQTAGAHVVYGVVAYKTHSKMLLIIRRENVGLRHYIHLGTGNYHPKTARLYTDYGLLSADPVLGNDVHELFLQLTSMGRVTDQVQILDSPFSLHGRIIELIERETEHAAHGHPARLIAKMNSLTAPKVIRALYRASQKGVDIDLIVRGMCCLRPGVAGVSENIRVRSIIGRFLEHTRVFYFGNNGNEELYLSSADWMERNFFRRVETCFPIHDERLRARIKQELDIYLGDNTQAWRLGIDGRYQLVTVDSGHEARTAQQQLMADGS